MDVHTLRSIMNVVVLLLLVSYTVTCGFILSGDVHYRQDLPILPQYPTYGRCLVLVGGNLEENNTEIYGSIINMAGGHGVAKIGVITAANAHPQDSYVYYRDLFLKYGALDVSFIPVDLNNTANNALQSTVDIIYQQTGFFFGGGDQARVLGSFLEPAGHFSPALIALHQMHETGAVISGTSAGTTCQTDNYMIKSGVSYDALLYGSYPDNGFSNDKHDEMIYAATGGLGFVKDFVLDTHFSQRGREGRMIRMLSDTKDHVKGSSRGIGVDENTALVVTHADTSMVTGKVIGAHGVTFFDLSRSRVIPGHNFHVTDVFLTYLTHGDVIHLDSLSVTYDAGKSLMTGHENYDSALVTDEVFYGASRDSTRKPAFVRIATSVYDTRGRRVTHGTTYESSPEFRVDLSATGHDSVGWVERKHSFHSDITSYQNLHVEISQN